MLRPLILALAFLLAGTIAGAAANEPVTIDAILSLTGSGAFIGIEEARSLRLSEDVIAKQGGINGRPVHFAIADDQSNPSVGLQLLNQAVARHAAVVIGPAGTATCNAALPLVKEHGPVIYCLTGNIRLPANGYAFAGGIFTYDLMEPILRFFHTRGWKRIALMTSTDASGQDFERAFDFAMGLPKNSAYTVTSHEHFNPTDLSVAAQVGHIKAANPDVVVGWTSGTPFGTMLHGFADAGSDLPILASNGDVVFGQLNQYASFIPKQLYFPGFLGMVRGSVGRGPIDDMQARYFAIQPKDGTAADVGSTIGWDPALIVVDALRHVGPEAPAEKVRDYLLGMHGFIGIFGVYDFRDGSQRGIGANTAVMLRWDSVPRTFAVVSRPGGFPK